MLGIRTRYVPLAELPLTTYARRTWLSREERAVHATFRSLERRKSWLAGRIVVKQLLRQMLASQDHRLAVATANRVHIESRSTRAGHGERPTVFVDSRRLAFAISISHTPRGVLVAAREGDEFTLGVDLVPTILSADKLRWAFTDAERDWLASSGSAQCRAEQLWAMKEAIYKACQRSEGFSPQAIEVVPGNPPRYLQRDATRELAVLQSWRIDGQHAALAVVTNNMANRKSPSRVTTYD